ncbi:Holliday junction resolvase RuvX [Patescibacteria group bacterium]|nr:Holliday junction resolvase RuvX [Patescibacteria group bacterium]
MKILGIDLGKRRIGLALGDTQERVVVGLSTIINDKKTLPTITEIIQHEKIEKIVIGLPRTMQGVLGDQASYTQKWAEKLERITQIPVEYADERLSSRMAKEGLLAIGNKLTKEDIDQAAAVLILQGYLDKLTGI